MKSVDIGSKIESLIRSAIEHNLISDGNVSIIKRCLRIYGRYSGYFPYVGDYFIEKIREKREI